MFFLSVERRVTPKLRKVSGERIRPFDPER
jgi:hypothetical protein